MVVGKYGRGIGRARGIGELMDIINSYIESIGHYSVLNRKTYPPKLPYHQPNSKSFEHTSVNIPHALKCRKKGIPTNPVMRLRARLEKRVFELGVLWDLDLDLGFVCVCVCV